LNDQEHLGIDVADGEFFFFIVETKNHIKPVPVGLVDLIMSTVSQTEPFPVGLVVMVLEKIQKIQGGLFGLVKTEHNSVDHIWRSRGIIINCHGLPSDMDLVFLIKSDDIEQAFLVDKSEKILQGVIILHIL
jgi:hypothetical protein